MRPRCWREGHRAIHSSLLTPGMMWLLLTTSAQHGHSTTEHRHSSQSSTEQSTRNTVCSPTYSTDFPHIAKRSFTLHDFSQTSTRNITRRIEKHHFSLFLLFWFLRLAHTFQPSKNTPHLCKQSCGQSANDELELTGEQHGDIFSRHSHGLAIALQRANTQWQPKALGYFAGI